MNEKNKMVKIERSYMNVIHLELNFEGIIDMVEWRQIYIPNKDNDKNQAQEEK